MQVAGWLYRVEAEAGVALYKKPLLGAARLAAAKPAGRRAKVAPRLPAPFFPQQRWRWRRR